MLFFVDCLAICFAVTGKISTSMIVCIFSAGCLFQPQGPGDSLKEICTHVDIPGICLIENWHAHVSKLRTIKDSMVDYTHMHINIIYSVHSHKCTTYYILYVYNKYAVCCQHFVPMAALHCILYIAALCLWALPPLNIAFVL